MFLQCLRGKLMIHSVNYVTNQAGETVGVLLDLETYQKLTNALPTDGEILTGLSIDELQALAESSLSPKDQTQLNDLLAKNEGLQLSVQEVAILDNLLAQVNQFNIIKTRAKYTLYKRQNSYIFRITFNFQNCRFIDI